MKRGLCAFASDRGGVTAVEYGALVMFVGLGLVLVLESIGVGLEGAFTQLKSVFGIATAGALN